MDSNSKIFAQTCNRFNAADTIVAAFFALLGDLMIVTRRNQKG